MAYLGPQQSILGNLKDLRRSLKQAGVKGRGPINRAIRGIKGGQAFERDDWRNLRRGLEAGGIDRQALKPTGRQIRGNLGQQQAQFAQPQPAFNEGQPAPMYSGRMPQPGIGPEGGPSMAQPGIGPEGGPAWSPLPFAQPGIGPEGGIGAQAGDLRQSLMNEVRQQQMLMGQGQGQGQQQFRPPFQWGGQGQTGGNIAPWINQALTSRAQGMPQWLMGGAGGPHNWGNNGFLSPLSGLAGGPPPSQSQSQSQPQSRVLADGVPLNQQRGYDPNAGTELEDPRLRLQRQYPSNWQITQHLR